MDYFKQLLELLKMEKEEDRLVYEKQTAHASISEKRANGLAWYPVAIRDTEMSRGDYITVTIERTTHLDIIHQLRFGMPAVLFSQHDAKNNRAEGIIIHQMGNQLKITLQTDDLPDWASGGKLGIDLLFDDNSYTEMTNALKTADALAAKDGGDQMIRVLTGAESPRFSNKNTHPEIPLLNNFQQEAVQKILDADDLAIVHGPPGTGKTTTVVQAIRALIARDGKQILVVAPSNTAVDLLSEKLHQEGLNTMRVGNPARVSERLMALTMDSRIQAHPMMKNMRAMKKRANDFRNMAHKYKRNFGKAERDQRKALFDEAHKIMREVINTEQFIIDDLVAKAQVITATLVGANHYTIKKTKFQTVVMDEAGQALEPAAWIPILKAQKLILAGDHLQLPPTVKSNLAAKKGLAISLLEKTVSLHPAAVVLLREQYRSNQLIMGFSSSEFYEHKLLANVRVAGQVLFENEPALEFIDTAGCGFSEKREAFTLSNPEEASFLIKHLDHLISELGPRCETVGFPTIGIVSPYKQQVNLLKEIVAQATLSKNHHAHIAVNTIDGFQGQERDIIYISMTRSNLDGEIGFLNDTRRMNVAMTRAKKKLVVIGDSSTLSQISFYARFIEYAEKHQAYRSAWEYMAD